MPGDRTQDGNDHAHEGWVLLFPHSTCSPSLLRKTRRELNSTHMGQSIKSGKELVQHPDQLLSGQGRGEVGKSFNICKKNTKQQGRDGVGRKRINILIHPGRHINNTQRNQPWSEISALPAMGVGRNVSGFNKHLSTDSPPRRSGRIRGQWEALLPVQSCAVRAT